MSPLHTCFAAKAIAGLLNNTFNTWTTLSHATGRMPELMKYTRPFCNSATAWHKRSPGHKRPSPATFLPNNN